MSIIYSCIKSRRRRRRRRRRDVATVSDQKPQRHTNRVDSFTARLSTVSGNEENGTRQRLQLLVSIFIQTENSLTLPLASTFHRLATPTDTKQRKSCRLFSFTSRPHRRPHRRRRPLWIFAILFCRLRCHRLRRLWRKCYEKITQMCQHSSHVTTPTERKKPSAGLVSFPNLSMTLLL